MQKRILVILICMFFISCGSMKNRQSNPFTVTAASYYSWFVNETERGIQVTINLRDVRDDVMFDSLVFRTMKIPVVTETSGDSVLVKAVLPGNESVLESRALPGSGLNRLIYTWKGEKLFYEIEEFTREDSKYLKRE